MIFVFGKVEFMGCEVEEGLDVLLLKFELVFRLVVFSHERFVHDGFLFIVLLCFVG